MVSLAEMMDEIESRGWYWRLECTSLISSLDPYQCTLGNFNSPDVVVQAVGHEPAEAMAKALVEARRWGQKAA